MTSAVGGFSHALAFLALSGAALGAGETMAPGDLVPSALVVDATGGNAILEPGETVVVEPSWRNTTAGPVSATGIASALTGPGAPGLYSIVDGAANYGTVAPGGSVSCQATGDCYRLAVGAASPRPALHWDATFGEATSTGSLKTWTLHIGNTFTDVLPASPFYRFVETLVHHGVTGGCGADTYCPASAITREQLAVFALAAKDGRFFVPPACTLGTEAFPDVPATSPFCRWVEELARRGVVGGCGGGQYCPTAAVSREQMAVFVLATKEGTGYVPPACVAGAELFADVPATSPFCRWIEELARRGVVSGCGGGNYCPSAPVAREQMAVFLAATFGLTAYGVPPHMFLVNTADDVDDGACSASHCSLREALLAANASPNPAGAREEIRFAIPGAGPHVIRPATALPAITDAVVIDGYSQPGATPNGLAAGSNAVLKIELDLSTNGAVVAAIPRVLLRGLALNRSPGPAVAMESTQAAVEGCFLGTDAGGTAGLGNAMGIGITFGHHLNQIGGTLPAQRNLISGNGTGIRISGSNGNVIQGNLIGTDRTGTVALPNTGVGISITAAGHFLNSDGNVIGGIEQGAGNVIAGNGGPGIWLSGYVGASILVVSNTRIQANLIGVAVNGAPLPGAIAIELNGSGVWGTLVGGTSVAPAGNSIAATDTGVFLSISVNGGPKGSFIRGNLIRGAQYGVRGSPSAASDIIANVIGPNGVSGIFLQTGSVDEITFRGNSISGHGGLGIDLAPAGVTPNDVGDADTGPNSLQNFPVVNSATASANALSIAGVLDSTPSSTFTVELFASPAAHPSGYGEGQTSLGTVGVTTDGTGHGAFAMVAPVVVPAGWVVTATATNAAGGTSEFSSARVVQ